MATPWILLPLYIYPATNAWLPLYQAIQAYPSVTFRIIINPNSGPGGPLGSYPDSNYIAGISKLNGYSNTELLGYVSTNYAQRAYADAKADVDAYIGWSKYTRSDIHVDGIFFDETPSSSDAKLLNYIGDLARYTRQKMPPNAHISLNPGTQVSDKWYAIADSVVAFENNLQTVNQYSPWSSMPTKQKQKSVFIIHTFQGTPSSLKLLVTTLHKNQLIAGSFITTRVNNYDGWGTYWNSYVGYVAEIVKERKPGAVSGVGRIASTKNGGKRNVDGQGDESPDSGPNSEPAGEEQSEEPENNREQRQRSETPAAPVRRKSHPRALQITAH